jgi:hypothetical protein
VFALAQALARYDFYAEQMGQCEARITATSAELALDTSPQASPPDGPWASRMRTALQQMLGVDLTAIPTIGVETALVAAAEVGADLSRFPSCGHFCAWLNLAPGTRISGGKTLPGRTPLRVNRLGQALRVAASTARTSQSFIGASHRARLARLDKPRAIKATAHQLARLIYAMLTHGQEYVEKGIDHYEQERRNRQLLALRRRAVRLGFALVEQPI